MKEEDIGNSPKELNRVDSKQTEGMGSEERKKTKV